MDLSEERLESIKRDLARSETGRLLLALSSERGVSTEILWDKSLPRERTASYEPLPGTTSSSRARLNPICKDGELVVGLGHELVHGLQHKVQRSLRPDDASIGVRAYERMVVENEKEANAMTCLLAWELKEEGCLAPYRATKADGFTRPLLKAFERSIDASLRQGISKDEASERAMKDCQKCFEAVPVLLELQWSFKEVARRNFEGMVNLQQGHRISR